jgi:thioredoxin 1
MHVSDTDFKKQVLESALPVLVDFWAPWCGPCKMIAPLLDELAKEYEKTLKIAKVNVDESPQIAAQYGIMSIPTIIFFKSGKVAAQAVGVLNRGELKKRIEENI